MASSNLRPVLPSWTSLHWDHWHKTITTAWAPRALSRPTFAGICADLMALDSEHGLGNVDALRNAVSASYNDILCMLSCFEVNVMLALIKIC